MKAWEICKKENLGKKYKDNNGDTWEVTKWEEGNGIHEEYDIKCVKNRRCITDDLFLSEIINMDFEEVVDWSKVPVDTKILVKDTIERKWHKRYFAKYEDGVVYAWDSGKASFTTVYTTRWDCAKLYEEGEE